MSLQVWLPLTKDLRQQGLSDATVTNNGATYSATDGKLGGCYSFNGSSNYIYAVKNIYNANYSYSLWFYTTSTSATQCLGCCRTAVGVGFAIFLIGGKLRIDGGSTSQWTTNYTYPANTWVHLTITYSNSTIKYYINGEYQQSYSAGLDSTKWGSTYSVGASQANGSSYGNYLTGKINDVRIYDHCLSPMEVKQISQGLVLHYPLNRQGWGQENLLKNSHIKYDNNGYYVGTYAFADPSKLETGKTYTLSFNGELQDDSQTGWYFNIFPSPYTAVINKTTDKEGRFAFSFTMPENGGSRTGIGCYSVPIGNRLGCAIWNAKLEEGEIATPWCPNSSDALATTMGFNGTTEYDTSGYCNNGTWHGTHTNTSDTPKYAVSTTATGSGTTYLEGPVLPAEAKTVALWIKNTSKSSNGAIFNDKTTGLQIGLLNSLLYMNSKASTAGFTTTHWVNGEWNHVVAINNNGTRSLYVNGQAETQSGASNYYIHNADNCWLWNRSYNNNYPFTGSLCDLRVYATALSADDVKSLYQNCATIDPDGTIRGQIRS